MFEHPPADRPKTVATAAEAKRRAADILSGIVEQ
jgi:hypothetical protein